MTRRPSTRRSPAALAVCALLLVAPSVGAQAPATVTVVDTRTEPMATGPFQPTWESLQRYQVPEWFRDAKFGIWAHWGPQCQPERGDWYARNMYIEGNDAYKEHLALYGHPSEVGFKDVINTWKAERWDPEKTIALYKRAGAQYFVALANHHDNLDLWDSKYHAWNSVAVGPKKDIVAGWAAAARRHGLKFGVSVHASHAWMWYEPSQGSDTKGPKAGVPYDGKLTKAEGKGRWWDGLDPQDLYEQRHQSTYTSGVSTSSQWRWGGGVVPPDQAYCDRFYNRTVDLINRYQPDLLYFDDTALPLWPVSDAGLKIAAHFYNSNMRAHGGALEAVLTGKVLDGAQRQAMVWDIERGASNALEPFPWQTDTCIGSWHYDRRLYERGGYKSAPTVVRMLADIVSKNGNLLLSVPLRGDGSLDEKELVVVEGIADWMKVNSEAIFGTRPWTVFGEGPASEAAAPLNAEGFNEGKGKPFTAEDKRFTTKDGVIYVIVLGRPDGAVRVRSFGRDAKLLQGEVTSVSRLGSAAPLEWTRNTDALVISAAAIPPDQHTVVFKVAIAK